jgi:hypothetical protein
MSVDEWLKAGETCEVLFELSAVDGRDDLVRLTPWLRAVGPLAALALELPRAAIAAVRPAAEGMASHVRLAHLEFRPGSAIALDELYRQVGTRLRAAGPGGVVFYAGGRSDMRRVYDFVPGAGLTGVLTVKLME